MVTLRNQFHELGNWHNKISIAAIVTRESLTQKQPADLSLPEMRKLIEKVVTHLNKIEDFISKADETVMAIKPFIYETMGADIEVPRRK